MSAGTVPAHPRRSRDSVSALRTRVRSDPVMIAVIGLTLVAALLRLWRIGHQGFWFDEANTSVDVHGSLGAMLGLLPRNQTTPPLFYVLAWAWARAFGFSETSLRLLPALTGVAVVPLMYAATSRLITRRAGLVAAALTACNPFLVWYSQEFRPYQLLVALGAAGLLAFAHARERASGRAMAAWAVISALAIADHYYALLTVVPEAVLLMWYGFRPPRVDQANSRDNRRSRLLGIGFVGLCGLALLPLAISQNKGGGPGWIAHTSLLDRVGQIAPQFLVGFQAPVQTVLELVALAAVLLALVMSGTRADETERRGAMTAGAFAVAGFVLNLILIAVGIDDLLTRNVLALWPPAAMLVAAGLGVRRAGLLGLAAAGALCVVGVVAVIGVSLDRGFQRPDWRAVAAALGDRPAPAVGERVILVQRYRDLLPLSLYMPALRTLPAAGARVSELDVVSISAPKLHLCWWGAACNLSGSRMQATYAIPGFHVLWRRQARQFTVLRLVATRPTRVTRALVAAALTTTKFAKDELLVQRR